MSDDPQVWIRTRHRKRKGTTYDVRWFDPVKGRWKSKNAGGDHKAALTEAARIKDQLRSGTYQEIRRVSWADFQAEHLKRIAGEENRRIAKHVLTLFGEVCKPSTPRAVNYGMIEEFVTYLKDKQENSLATVNKYLRYLRAAFNKAMKRGYIGRNPMVSWDWEREQEQAPRVLNEEEKAKLLEACPTRQWRTFVHVGLTTGCRRGELLGLAWKRVDFSAATLLVTSTKGKKDRLLPLNPAAVAMLRELQASTLKDGGPFCGIKEDDAPREFKKIVEAAKIDPCTIHDLRRTFCTDLAAAGVNAVVIQKLAGHASLNTTQRYYTFVGDDTMRAAVEKLTGAAG